MFPIFLNKAKISVGIKFYVNGILHALYTFIGYYNCDYHAQRAWTNAERAWRWNGCYKLLNEKKHENHLLWKMCIMCPSGSICNRCDRILWFNSHRLLVIGDYSTAPASYLIKRTIEAWQKAKQRGIVTIQLIGEPTFFVFKSGILKGINNNC